MLRSPTTTEGNEYELAGTSAVQGHPDDVEEIKKNPMIGEMCSMQYNRYAILILCNWQDFCILRF